ncbi:MAG: 5'/3'-nucleotidase SurE [Spongiibacteraceae bacterium]
MTRRKILLSFFIGYALALPVALLAADLSAKPPKPGATTTPKIQSLKILLSDDDGLTANVKALQQALLAAGHQVVISVPCQNQSGKGAAANFLTPIGPLTKDCRGDSAKVGAPGVGRIAALNNAFYVDGTPVMATLYGIDIASKQVWGTLPDLVISGPNEGQNLGSIVISSGTVSNAQMALSRGLPAIAVSADINTIDNAVLAREVADLTVKLVATLQAKNNGTRILPKDFALNVNYPKFEAGHSQQLKWRATRFGNFDWGSIRFVEDLSADPTAAAFGLRDVHAPGITISVKNKTDTTPETDRDSEALQSLNGFVTVTPMESGYEISPAGQQLFDNSVGRALEEI